MAASPASMAASHMTGRNRRSGETGGSTGADGGTSPRALVVTVKVVVVVAVANDAMLAGLNEAIE